MVNTCYDTLTLYMGENGEKLYEPKEITDKTSEPRIDSSKHICYILGSKRSMHNFLRYIGRQAEYDNTPDPSWIAKKIALLLGHLKLTDNPNISESYRESPLYV